MNLARLSSPFIAQERSTDKQLTTDTTNTERGRQQGPRALAAALKGRKRRRKIQQDLVNKVYGKIS